MVGSGQWESVFQKESVPVPVIMREFKEEEAQHGHSV